MANQKLSATISIGATVGNTVKRIVGVSKALDGVDKEISGIVARQKELDKQRKVLERQKKPVDELQREYADLGRTLDTLREKQRRLTNVQERSVRVASDLGGALGTATRQARTLAGIAAGNGLLGAAITALTVKVANSTEEITRWSGRVGTTPEFFSQLSYAAKRFGAGTDDVADGLKEMQMRLDEFAKTGKGPAEEALKRLGISQQQAAAMTKDTAAAWSILRERISKVSNGAARQRISDEILGGTAAEKLIELLQLSQEEYLKLGEEASKVATVTGEMSKTAREFVQEQNRLISNIEGTLRTVGTEVMPVITAEMENLNEWIVDNRDDVRDFARSLREGVQAAIPIVRWLASSLAKVLDWTGWIVGKAAEMAGGWENLGVVVGVAFVTPTILGLLRVGASIASLIASIGGITTAWKAAEAAGAAAAGAVGAAAGKGTAGGTGGKSGRGLIPLIGRVLPWLAAASLSGSTPGGGGNTAENRAKLYAAIEEDRRKRPEAYLPDWASREEAERRALMNPNPNARSGRTTARANLFGDDRVEHRTEVNLGGITINATGMDPKEVVDLAMERLRQFMNQIATGGLFDGAR